MTQVLEHNAEFGIMFQMPTSGKCRVLKADAHLGQVSRHYRSAFSQSVARKCRSVSSALNRFGLCPAGVTFSSTCSLVARSAST